ncbi:MAG: hypothetical protein ACLFQ6_09910 [Candidatus Sumerlaeia bacterium]
MTKRMFSEQSFWNQALSTDARTDPRSDFYLAEMDQGDAGSGPLHMNLHKFTMPVYEANASTPRRTVHRRPITADHHEFRRGTYWKKDLSDPYWFGHGPGFGENVPIPENATPDPDADSHMAVVDWEARIAWDMWGVRIREDGEYESFTGMVYSLDDDGVWKREDFAVKPGESIHFYGPGRAAGVPIIAGLFMYDEVVAGHIPHKLALATWHNACGKFCPPAAWTDGFRADGLPEGAVLQLDPDLDLKRFEISPAAATVARAMQEYGAVNVDNARGNVIYGEGLWAHPEKSWEGLLGERELEVIPMDHYRVIQIEGIIEEGEFMQGRERIK